MVTRNLGENARKERRDEPGEERNRGRAETITDASAEAALASDSLAVLDHGNSDSDGHNLDGQMALLDFLRCFNPSVRRTMWMDSLNLMWVVTDIVSQRLFITTNNECIYGKS